MILRSDAPRPLDMLDVDPVRVGRFWLWPDGTTLPAVAGGEGGEGGQGEGGGQGGAGDSSGNPPGGGGQGGGSAGEAGDLGFPANTPIAEMTVEQQVAYWRHQSRKHEARARDRADYDDLKAKADQYDALAAASKTEHQLELEAAKEEAAKAARAEERARAAGRLVEAEMRAAAAGRLTAEQLTAVIEPLDRSKFLDGDGEVDAEKVATFIASIAPAAADGGQQGGRFPDFGQGRRQTADTKPSVASGAERYKAARRPATATT